MYTRIIGSLVIAMFVIVGGVVGFADLTAAPNNATINTSEYVDRVETYSNGVLTLRTEIFIAVEDGLHYTRTSDANGIITEVLSLPAQITQYEANKAAVELANAKFQSTQNLIGEVEPGEFFSQWVANRSAELTTCQGLMNSAEALGVWNQQTNQTQNQIMGDIYDCVATEARITKKALQHLEDILRTEGIIQ